MDKNLKLLLLQIREDPTVKKEEHESFARYANLPLESIDIFDVFKTPHFDHKILENYDGLFVGGASEASVLEPETYTFVPSIINLLKYCAQNNFPTFASCFGFQAAILAFGGKVIRDTENFEMGTYPLSLTQAAHNDPIYENIANNFMAVSVHQEKALECPPDCELLAYTEECVHSFRYKEKDFWAFQFHPELDKACLTQRLGVYAEKYTEDKDHFQKIIASLVETPDSNLLVKNFTKFLSKKKAANK